MRSVFSLEFLRLADLTKSVSIGSSMSLLLKMICSISLDKCFFGHIVLLKFTKEDGGGEEGERQGWEIKTISFLGIVFFSRKMYRANQRISGGNYF